MTGKQDGHHEEHHRNISDGWVRAGIFGVSDGLVTNVSLILGIAGAHPGHSVVRLAGLAGLIAGGFSMSSGEYLSMRAQKEMLEYEISKERQAILENPEQERLELRETFITQGINPELADSLATDLMKDPELALRTHAREELGVDPSATGSPWMATIASFISFSIGAFIPLVPWIVTSTGNAVGWSIGLGLATAAGVGAGIGLLTGRGVWRWASRQLIIAAASSAVTYGIGHLIGA